MPIPRRWGIIKVVNEALPAGRYAVLVLDRAVWQTGKLPHFANVSLLPFPAGSPEHNPAKQVWQHLR
jgi:hypothetical protein